MLPVVWGLEGEDKMCDAADDHRPADEQSYPEAGDRRDEDREEASQNEQDAEGDGPVDGFSGCSGEGIGCAAPRTVHRSVLQKTVDVWDPSMHESSRSSR